MFSFKYARICSSVWLGLVVMLGMHPAHISPGAVGSRMGEAGFLA